MPGPTDERPISLGEIVTASDARDLAALVDRMAHHHNWEALIFLFKMAARPERRARLSLVDINAAAQTFHDTVRAQRRNRRDKAPLDDDLRAAHVAAAEALLALLRRPAEGDADRRSARLGATLLFDGGDFHRAASLFEELGDDPRAADAFGALGDLDKMEDALARVDARQQKQRRAVNAMRGFEALLGAGERAAAVALAATLPEGSPEAATAHQAARQLDARLCRARGVTLRLADASLARFAALPAVLGRDPGVELPLRDPGVSRRHAIIQRQGGELTIEDAGSRTGLRLGGARVGAPLPLRGDGELDLGPGCRLRFHAGADADAPLVLRGLTGLDRPFQALVGDGPLALEVLIPGAAGLSINFDGGVARLVRTPEVIVRVAGQLVGTRCDLLHGDVIDVRQPDAPAPQPALRLEVP